MKPLTAVSLLLLAILTGCATPPPAADLILTEQDYAIKQQRSNYPGGIYVCPGHKVEVSK